MTDAFTPPTGPQFDAERTPAEGENGDDALLARFDQWDVGLQAHWSKWREDARFWYGFVSGDQWTDAERSRMEDAEKIAVTFNLIGPVVDAVQGAEINNRQQPQFYPRTVGDTGVSDVLTQGADYVSEGCNGDQEDSEAFWDCLVCGLGWTETRPEVEGDELDLIKERVDPLQLLADPAARKRCLEDKRYVKREIPMSEDEFEAFKDEIGRPDIEGLGGQRLGDGKRLTVVNPRQRYTHGMLGEGDQGQGDVTLVCEWQWWDYEPVILAPAPSATDPNVVALKQHTPDEFAALQQQHAMQGLPAPKSSASRRKVYYRAFVGDGQVLFKEELAEGDFRYKCITGKRDRNAGTWFGLVKPMVDPGRFVNKLYSEVLHIVRTNANGGMALEEDAVEDIRKFESTWAATDKITWLKAGSLSGPHGAKMLPKTPPPVQAALFQLMEFARDMVKATTGVNEEILGLVQREQAGVLEQQRKQAAYGILSAFFDAKRRYQRNQGKLLLGQMRVYFPPDKLVRIVDQGAAQYVPVALSLDAEQYDVVVDEAPATPDQKARIIAVLMPLLPQLLQAELIGPETLADIIPYLPIPAVVANKLANDIRAKAAQPPDPNAVAAQAAELANKQADTGQKQADAQYKKAKAFKDITDAHASHVGLGVDFLHATQEANNPKPQLSRQVLAEKPIAGYTPPPQGAAPGPGPAPLGAQPGEGG
jgi:hypothetical protein